MADIDAEQSVTSNVRASLLHVMPTLQRLVVSTRDIRNITHELKQSVHWADLLVLIILGWGTIPICSVLFLCYKKYVGIEYNQGYLYQLAFHIQQASQLAIIVYLVDCLVIALASLGFDFARLNALSTGFAKILFIAWIAQRLCVFKRYLLGYMINRSPEKLGRLAMVDKLADALLYCWTAFVLLDILDVEMGFGVKSILAVVPASTLIIGLASKDVAAMFVNGLTLSTSGRFKEGDVVRFGDNTSGIIHKVGWMQTQIRGFDNIIEVIPNSELGMMRVKNVSRAQQSQVTTTLHFKFEDADKLPLVQESILEEVKKACPELITDGSRPFRCLWNDIKEWYLEVQLNAHFNLPATGAQYFENRQQVMHAIHRACKTHGVEFAKPRKDG